MNEKADGMTGQPALYRRYSFLSATERVQGETTRENALRMIDSPWDSSVS